MILGALEIAIREKIPLTLVVVNDAAHGYAKGLQHALFQGRYQSSDFKEMNYADTTGEMGRHSLRMEDPKNLGGASGGDPGKVRPQSDGRGRDSWPKPDDPRSGCRIPGQDQVRRPSPLEVCM